MVSFIIFVLCSSNSFSSFYTLELEDSLKCIIKSQNPNKEVKLSQLTSKWEHNKLNVSFTLELSANGFIENYSVEGMLVDSQRDTRAIELIFLGECGELNQEMQFIKGTISEDTTEDLITYAEVELTLTKLEKTK